MWFVERKWGKIAGFAKWFWGKWRSIRGGVIRSRVKGQTGIQSRTVLKRTKCKKIKFRGKLELTYKMNLKSEFQIHA